MESLSHTKHGGLRGKNQLVLVIEAGTLVCSDSQAAAPSQPLDVSLTESQVSPELRLRPTELRVRIVLWELAGPPTSPNMRKHSDYL